MLLRAPLSLSKPRSQRLPVLQQDPHAAVATTAAWTLVDPDSARRDEEDGCTVASEAMERIYTPAVTRPQVDLRHDEQSLANRSRCPSSLGSSSDSEEEVISCADGVDDENQSQCEQRLQLRGLQRSPHSVSVRPILRMATDDTYTLRAMTPPELVAANGNHVRPHHHESANVMVAGTFDVYDDLDFRSHLRRPASFLKQDDRDHQWTAESVTLQRNDSGYLKKPLRRSDSQRHGDVDRTTSTTPSSAYSRLLSPTASQHSLLASPLSPLPPIHTPKTISDFSSPRIATIATERIAPCDVAPVPSRHSKLKSPAAVRDLDQSHGIRETLPKLSSHQRLPVIVTPKHSTESLSRSSSRRGSADSVFSFA